MPKHSMMAPKPSRMSRMIVDREPASHPYNIRRVEQLILEDRRMNVRDISAELGIRIGSVESIIYEHLQYRKLTPRWVPKLVNFEQKFTRLEVCQRLLTRYEAERDNFLTRFFTTDETWVHYYVPKARCHLKSGGRRRKGRQSKRRQQCPRVRICVLCSGTGRACCTSISCAVNVASMLHISLTF
nr:unnamed protein product [Callosobruchus analis]